MEKIATINDLANIIRKCDTYLFDKYSTSIYQILEMNLDNKIELAMMLLISNDEIKQLFDEYNLYGIIEEFLTTQSQKKLLEISDESIMLSSRQPKNLTLDEYKISEERLDEVFGALENNMAIFEKLYKDKIWILETSIGQNEKISISKTRFFHLLGFDEKHFYDSESLSKFLSLFPNPDNIKELMRGKKDLFEVLVNIIKNENSIKSAILDETLYGVVNPRKLEVKNYSFERIGLIEHSSGIILYDKNIATQYGFHTRLQTDLILLQNFIRKYNLEFIFTMYRNYKHTLKAKDAESLIMPSKGYENSEFLYGQKASISLSAKQYLPKDFEFTIKDSSGNETPFSDPKEYEEFTDEDKAQMAKSILSSLPYLDNAQLEEIYLSLVNNTSIEKGNTYGK